MPKYKTAEERDNKLKELRDDAKRLKEEFDQGYKLAPFECCWLWREAGFRADELPEWVLKWVLTDIVSNIAEYFSKRPFSMFEADLNNPKFATPRAFIKMKSKERKKREPSLDKIAGLSGTQGQPSAWLWKAERGRVLYIDSYLGELKKRAREGNNKYVLRIGERAGQTVPILDKDGRLREEVQNEVARLFKIGGWEPGMGWDRNMAKTVRRRLKRLEK